MANPIVHFEIGCRDKEKTAEFYSKLFNWEMQAQGPAINIKTGGDDDIDGHITALGHEPHHYVTIYVEVDDLGAFLKKAESLGGKTVIPPVELPSRGSFAWFTDPDGNIVALWKPAKS